jgi:hypothetical protein
LGDVLNNGNQPGKPLTVWASTANLTFGVRVWKCFCQQIADLGGDNKEYNNRLNTNFNLTYTFSPKLKAVGYAGYYNLNTDIRTQGNSIGWYDYTGTVLISNLPSRSFYQRSSRLETNYNLNGYLEYENELLKDHHFKAVLGAQYERYENNIYFAKTFDVLANVPPSFFECW